MEDHPSGRRSRRSGSTQERGRQRRDRLCAAAAACLAELPLDELTLGIVAERAGVPKASAYHFYSNIHDLYAELIGRVSEALAAGSILPEDAHFDSWQDIVLQIVLDAAALLDADPVGRQLVLGPKVAPDLKWRDRRNDIRLAAQMREQVERFFRLPDLAGLDRRFYYAIELGDLLFCLSVEEHGCITPEMRLEGARVVCAYLALYIPPILPRAGRGLPLTTK